MSRIKKLIDEAREAMLPLKDLQLGLYQVRNINTGRDISELAQSIKENGLLYPIYVCPVEGKEGKYEIIAGQRRFSAFQELQEKTIKAKIIDEVLDVATGKQISLVENLARLDIPKADEIETMRFLYDRYKSIQAVADRLGISYARANKCLRIEGLSPMLKKAYYDKDLSANSAARIQKVLEVGGQEDDVENTKKLIKEMSTMNNPQQDLLIKERVENPAEDIDSIIERVKKGGKLHALSLMIGTQMNASLRKASKSEEINVKEKAVELIQSGLEDGGYWEEE